MFMNYRVLKLIKGTVHQFELKKKKKKGSAVFIQIQGVPIQISVVLKGL